MTTTKAVNVFRQRFIAYQDCTKDIFINILNVIHGSSSSGSHSLSIGCFDAIKIAWLGKVHREQNHEADQFIDGQRYKA
ncbi:MAG: hypothetical protein WA421_18190 [Nitrososphaeraceae archaeon]